jgi:hypothetical protein
MATPRDNRLDIAKAAQTLAAYLAIPALLLYPFGFVAFFLQFTRYFGLDFYTASYAASLANRMVVIGQGATILVAALVGSVLLSGIVGQILLRHENRTNSSPFRRRLMRVVKLGFACVMALLLYILYSRILSAGRVACEAIVGRQSKEPRDEALRHQLNLWPDSLIPALILVAGGLFGGWLMYKSFRRYRQSSSVSEGQDPAIDYRLRSIFRFLVRGITQGWILPGLTAAYIFGIAASLVLAWSTPGFMPFATYGETVEYPGQEPTTDRFLSHTEGHWHFLHRVQTEAGEREYRVLALRESAVTYVRIRPHPWRYPRVAPFPWPEDAATWNQRLCGAD